MTNNTQIELNIPVIHQYWMDSGLLGFYSLAKKAHKNYSDISLSADDDGVHLKGSKNSLESFLNNVYQSMLDEYYNTSSPKQIEEKKGFYYDSKTDEFVRFPKVKTMGISEIIFSQAPRPTGKSVAYVKKKEGAVRKNQLPEEYAHLQNRFDDFIKENGLEANIATFLIDGKNAYKPKVNISLTPKKRKKRCYLCGSESYPTSEVSGTVFPMITGSSGFKTFNSGCGNPFSVCSICDYISKFVPVTGYYSMNGGDTFVFLPYSHSFSKMTEVFPLLEAAKKYDKYRLRNYEEKLGKYFQKPYEQFFSFIYTIYLKTCIIGGTEDEEGEINYDEMFDINISKAPLSYFVLQFQKFSDTFSGKLVWNFTDAVYLFRLFSKLHESEIDLKEVMSTLVDDSQNKDENKTILRNKVCERILKKQHVADLVEKHVYHINSSEKKSIKPVADFAEIYEKIIYEDDIMKQDLINVAVSLGKTIGLTLGEQGKKGKGDLFQLKKARKPEDFLNEISRIQMKYNVSVTKEIYENGELFDSNFNEFKQFCMIAALNSFNAKTADKFTKGD